MCRPAFLERRGVPGTRHGADQNSKATAGRCIRYSGPVPEAAIDGVIVASLYLPNGNPWPGPKFDYKMAWFERLLVHARSLQRSGRPVELAGNYNVVPTDVDIYSPTS